MHLPRPSRKHIETMAKPINLAKSSTSLDPTKYSVVTLEHITGNKNKHEFASTPNPLYFCDNRKDKKFGDQPMGDPPNLASWNMDNLTDDPDDSDYIGESGDEDSKESSSAGSLEDKN